MSSSQELRLLPTETAHPCDLCEEPIPAGLPRLADYAEGQFVAIICLPCAQVSEALTTIGHLIELAEDMFDSGLADQPKAFSMIADVRELIDQLEAMVLAMAHRNVSSARLLTQRAHR
jgi:hypothetical protein